MTNTTKIKEKKCTCSQLKTAEDGTTVSCPCIQEGIVHNQFIGHCVICGGQAFCEPKIKEKELQDKIEKEIKDWRTIFDKAWHNELQNVSCTDVIRLIERVIAHAQLEVQSTERAQTIKEVGDKLANFDYAEECKACDHNARIVTPMLIESIRIVVKDNAEEKSKEVGATNGNLLPPTSKEDTEK